MSDSSTNLIQVAIPGIRKPLTYAIPDSLLRTSQTPPALGQEVLVELGRREVSGWIVRFGSEGGEIPAEKEEDHRPQAELFLDLPKTPRIKSVRELLPAFLPDQLPLFEWMASYYGVPISEIMENALPAREPEKLEELIQVRTPIAEQWHIDPRPLEEKLRRAKSQKDILRHLMENGSFMAKALLLESFPNAHSALSGLEEKGIIERVLSPKPLADKTKVKNLLARPPLTPGQEKSLQIISSALNARTFSPILLFGVTGSGKTEVYMRAIQKVLSEGGGALVIVPEIALTPQLYDQFEERLGEPIALLHSEVGRRSRWQSWEGLLAGNLRVAIGARSAVFAPVRNLRLVVVDEEHESSYKQSDGLRYHARDVAVMRAKLLGSSIVLGSATPSFESLVNASQGRYQLAQMPDRVSNRNLPEIEVVDLNKIRKKEMPSPNFSPPLFDAMKASLEKGGQAVILYNRRGFSSYLQCHTCNEVVLCPNCSIAMTYHKKRHRLLCHYCSESMTPPTLCAFCRDPRTTAVEEVKKKQKEGEGYGELVQRGSGTEHIVEELQQLFPQAVIERMDRDTVGKKDSYRRILGRMRSGEANILVGTQMIAKGHDLPGVTVVGIIDADIGLHAPDFRSSEKTFQLITQASGRAGRGTEPGKVFIQTRQPMHPTIVATQGGRFKAFARYELEYRKQLHYPPWGRLLRLVISSPHQQEAFESARLVKETLEGLIKECPETDELKLLGPAPAPHERLRGRFRWHILVKSKSAKGVSRIADALDRWKSSVRGFQDFRLVIDVDPVEML